jgi:hypothetical protein
MGTVRHSTTQKLGGAFTAESDDGALVGRVAAFYHEALKANPKALGFLQGLGLRNGQVVEHLQIGFSDRTLGYRGAELRGRLQALGILRDTGHEVFRGCVTVPILDGDGRISPFHGVTRQLDERIEFRLQYRPPTNVRAVSRYLCAHSGLVHAHSPRRARDAGGHPQGGDALSSATRTYFRRDRMTRSLPR